MGRKVQTRTDYVRDSQNVYRLREALRIDHTLAETDRNKAVDACSALMAILMSIDEKKGQNGRRKTAIVQRS